VLAAGVYSLSINYQSFIVIKPPNRSTAVSPKKFLGSAKKRWQKTYSLTSFGRAVNILRDLAMCMALGRADVYL